MLFASLQNERLGAFQSSLKLLVFAPIDQTATIRAGHESVSLNQFVELLRRQPYVAGLTDAFDDGDDRLPLLPLPLEHLLLPSAPTLVQANQLLSHFLLP